MNLLKNIKEFFKDKPSPLLVILGPTASGKTALSIALAKALDGEIISTDSRQIYREMEIGTDAITEQEQQGVPHHMLGISTPDKTVSLAEYKDQALTHIKDIHKKGKIPMLVGGTGLYVSAITQGYDVPRIPPNQQLRDQLYKEAEEKGNQQLHDKLKKLDPQAAQKIHPNNLRYVVRALEINLEKGHNKQDQKTQAPFDVYMLGIDWPRDQLYERINYRVTRQLERGLIEEVQKLLDKGYDTNSAAMSSLGVKEIIPYIRGKMPLEECVKVLQQGTRNYAKRQMTWFRRYDNVNWLTPKQLEECLKKLSSN